MCKNEKPNRIIEMQMFYGDIGRNINNYRNPHKRSYRAFKKTFFKTRTIPIKKPSK